MDKRTKPEKKEKPIPSSADKLTKSEKPGTIELSETELGKVAGGCATGKHIS